MTESNPSWMEKVEEMAQIVAAREGCILYDIEFVGIGKGRTLRVFIDKEVTTPDTLKSKVDPHADDETADGTADETGDEMEASDLSEDESDDENPEAEVKGVGIKDCSNVSRALDQMLDENDVIPGEAYYLEVSTPGLDRWLRRPWHFQKAVGRKIWVKTRGSFENYGVTDKKLKAAKQIEDVLKSFDGENLFFQVKEGELKIPLSAVEKSKVAFALTKGQKK